MKKFYFATFLMCALSFAQAQVTVDTTLSIQQLIQNFVGTNITISNVTHTGVNGAIGSFNSANGFPMSMGIALTSGVLDTNFGTPAFNSASGYNNMPGDADLDAYSTGSMTYDASVLEFDFVASGTQFEFHYAFMSEEYNEYVGSTFNDIFALFLSGPGITTPINLATIPGTTLPVAINNVNNGNMGMGPCSNCAYFIDNTNGSSLVFDGLTTTLTAQHAITPGATYHVKIAVADVGDMILDSGVLLEAYSLKSTGNVAVVETGDIDEQIIFDGVNITMNNVSSRATIQVIDATGKVCHSQIGNAAINTSPFSKGAYIVRVADGQKVHQGRIVL